MGEITTGDSDGYLVPELRGSEWELEYAEVDSDEHPHAMAYGWLVEAYVFHHPDRDIRLTCNVEAYEDRPGERNYEMYFYLEEELHFLDSFETRKNWWSGIRQTMRKNSEVIEL
jgi:hypothetical protein